MKKQDLKLEEFDIYYKRYLDKLNNETALLQGFIDGKSNTIAFLKSISENKLDFKYQPKKWSIKEILQHLIDTERIFMYRCFRIARRDTVALAGYDQEIYNTPSKANNKSLDDLLNEFKINRNNSIALLQSLSNDDLCFIGNANGDKMSARAAAFIIIGHDIWHTDVIKNKYLNVRN
ncbi:DinB family protein [Polaribacter vadi]|uniref:DinB family protein n=1 Tax=Polaribacter TaxID=52959 RepID=UPI001C0A1931|nr:MULTISPECIES: DinB family protein [Polaribacter]MBU3012160.1 DinB family protein [Polaribacter vadi]MDO6741976.1 DinB family protein [Polaribacter sp. 1_MG-2023]